MTDLFDKSKDTFQYFFDGWVFIKHERLNNKPFLVNPTLKEKNIVLPLNWCYFNSPKDSPSLQAHWWVMMYYQNMHISLKNYITQNFTITKSNEKFITKQWIEEISQSPSAVSLVIQNSQLRSLDFFCKFLRANITQKLFYIFY